LLTIAGRGWARGVANLRGQHVRCRPARPGPGGAPARARCPDHHGVDCGLCARSSGSVGRSRGGGVASAAHVQSSAPVTAGLTAVTVGYYFSGFPIGFAILPPRAGDCPRAVLVATALDDIPARPPRTSWTTRIQQEQDIPMSLTPGRKAEVIKSYAVKT